MGAAFSVTCKLLCVEYDCKHYNKSVFLSGDCGDHVVVINTKEIAMEGDSVASTFKHFHHSG